MLLATGVFLRKRKKNVDKTIDFLQKCDTMDSQGKYTELKLIQCFICIISNLNFLKKNTSFYFFTLNCIHNLKSSVCLLSAFGVHSCIVLDRYIDGFVVQSGRYQIDVVSFVIQSSRIRCS